MKIKSFSFRNYSDNECICTLNPMDHRIVDLEELGLIPVFINNGNVVEDGFKTGLQNGYQMPLSEMSGGHITSEGKYVFRGDPDLYPLAKYETETEACYQYDYAIVAIVSKATGDTFVTRMD